MQKEIFEIVRNYRKTVPIHNRKKRTVPPITIKTRRMSKIRNTLPINPSHKKKQFQLSQIQSHFHEEIVLKDLSSGEIIKDELEKDDERPFTPFGDNSIERETLLCFL